MIKNIIFDLGGVLVNFHPEETLKAMNLSDKEAAEITKHTALNPVWSELDRGVLDVEQVFKLMLDSVPENYKKAASDFLHYNIQKTVTSFSYSKNWVKTLKEKGYKIYLLTNYPSFMFDFHWNSKVFTFTDYVDGMIVSAKEKVIKPDSKIYEKLLERYSLVPSECVFIDDRKENIEGAKNCGINGIHFTTFEEVKAALEKLLN